MFGKTENEKLSDRLGKALLEIEDLKADRESLLAAVRGLMGGDFDELVPEGHKERVRSMLRRR